MATPLPETQRVPELVAANSRQVAGASVAIGRVRVAVDGRGARFDHQRRRLDPGRLRRRSRGVRPVLPSGMITLNRPLARIRCLNLIKAKIFQDAREFPRHPERKRKGIGFPFDLEPRTLANNLLAPFLVAAIEDYFKSTFVALLRYSNRKEQFSRRESGSRVSSFSRFRKEREPSKANSRSHFHSNGSLLSADILTNWTLNLISRALFENHIVAVRNLCSIRLRAW